MALSLLHQLTHSLAEDVRRRGQLGVAWPTAALRHWCGASAGRVGFSSLSPAYAHNVWDGMVKEQLEAVNVWERQLEVSGSEGEEEECSTPPDQRWSRRSRSSTLPRRCCSAPGESRD